MRQSSTPLFPRWALALVFTATVAVAHANPIVVGTSFYGVPVGWEIGWLAVPFVPTVIIEALVVWRFVFFLPLKRIFVWVFLIHLLSYPLTQFLGLLIGPFAEIFAILLEAGCYIWLFTLHGEGLGDMRPQSIGRCLEISVTANLITWVIGVIGFAVLMGPPHTGHPHDRVKSDLRSMATALGVYAIDSVAYPARPEQLTTPVAYITRVFSDPHSPTEPPLPLQIFVQGSPKDGGFVIWSVGPDQIRDLTHELLSQRLDTSVAEGLPFVGLLETLRYDPTNGTNSRGDIYRLGGSWLP